MAELGFKPRLPDPQGPSTGDRPAVSQGSESRSDEAAGTALLEGDRGANTVPGRWGDLSHSLYSGSGSAGNLGGTGFAP